MARCSSKLDTTGFLSLSSLLILYAFQVPNGNVDLSKFSTA